MHDTEEITKKPISIFLYAAQRHLGIHNKLIMLLLGPFCSSDEAGYDSIIYTYSTETSIGIHQKLIILHYYRIRTFFVLLTRQAMSTA